MTRQRPVTGGGDQLSDHRADRLAAADGVGLHRPPRARRHVHVDRPVGRPGFAGLEPARFPTRFPVGRSFGCPLGPLDPAARHRRLALGFPELGRGVLELDGLLGQGSVLAGCGAQSGGLFGGDGLQRHQ